MRPVLGALVSKDGRFGWISAISRNQALLLTVVWLDDDSEAMLKAGDVTVEAQGDDERLPAYVRRWIKEGRP